MNNTGNNTAISEFSTLLVLRHRNNSVGIVEAVNQYGNIIDVKPERSGVDTVMRIDSSAGSFMDFYSEFYHQLKNPSEYSFFKVREVEARETARGLQEYINGSSETERQDLQEFEVCVEAVDAIRNKKYADRENSVLTNDSDCGLSDGQNSSLYRYQMTDFPWESLAELDLNREKLESLGALEPLLKGYKTPMLVPVPLSDGYSVSMVEARLQLRLDDKGEVVVRIHTVLEKPDFNEKFKGHEFTEEDKFNLLTTGNMGRVVGLVDPWTDEAVPSLISLDRLTNELIPLRMEFVRIPAVICGVTLDLEQVKVLRDGKVLFIEKMLSKKGRLFSAVVQFNTDKQWIEFLFKKNLQGYDRRTGEHDSANDVPTVFRGKYLRKWQMDKLKAGEMAYISGLLDKNGKKYQGYLSFDKRRGEIEFSFKNSKKKLTEF
ncbi:DUF3945 domain-containing protein [Chryseobacterium sp. Leaf180]|uniref:DUF3945 domain-containing protein n=1 Tax=Chryseobacterium sp. Leaf180 TaxID=1736289 RepID=UPI000AC9E314|nr:DUF3945 domain-containing protein [Chryseobacterium sp. Leaf180]